MTFSFDGDYGVSEAVLERTWRSTWRVTLDGESLGEHTTEDAARGAVVAAMRERGFVLAPGEHYGPFVEEAG